MKSLRIMSNLALFLLVILVSVLMPVSSTKAVSLNVGFFSGDYVNLSAGSDVLIGGIPNYAGDKEGFISFIERKLANGGSNNHDHIGAAFIVYTMLGYEPGGNDKNGPSESEIDDWKKRIRNAGVTLETSWVRSGINSTVYRDAGGLDATFFSNPVEGDTLIFKYNGVDVYWLRLACANPIGDMPGLPEVAEWYIEGESYAKIGSSGARRQGNDAITVKPTVSGNRVYWDHVVRNTGPDDMDRDIRVWVERRDWSLETNNWLNYNRDSSDWVELRRNRTYTKSINHTITQNDVGKKLCQRVAWQDNAWDDDSIGYSDYACANVPYEFNLTPTLTTEGSIDNSEPGNEIKVNISVKNDGPTKSRPAQWQLTEIIIDKGGSMPNNMAGGQSSQSPCVNPVGSSYFGRTKSGGNDSPGCQVVDSGSNLEFMPSGWTNPSIGPYNRPNGIPDLVAGSHICYALSVSPSSHESSDWRHSGVTCYVVSKKPKVQFWGGDVRASVELDDGKVITAITSKRGALFGSWAEYAIMASGSVGSASGAGLSGGIDGRSGLSQRAYNDLTFANYGGNFGQFGSLASSRDPSAYFGNTAGSDTLLDGHTLAPGEKVVLNIDGDVVISGDVIYRNGETYSNLYDLPQAVIIANNIIIQNNVGRIDAWLVARDNLSTCEAGDPYNILSGVTVSSCDNPLMINGPVTASRIFLKRTAGGEASNPNIPAEIINLRPDAYMWGYERSQDRGLIKTTYIRELPPRY